MNDKAPLNFTLSTLNSPVYIVIMVKRLMWLDYMADKDPAGHTVVGKLLVQADVYSPQLHNRRDLYVYLPPAYEQNQRRYPVLYMHDGQNLFDAPISYAGEWQVDETLCALRDEGIEAMVVGIPNAGKRRAHEYNPFDHKQHGKGQGDQYLAFLVETVKPMIDRDFRTLPERDHTGLMGSSLGGLISLYGFFRCPEVFGFTGVVSPAFTFTKEDIYKYVEAAHYIGGKIYMDVGTHEIGARWDALTFNMASRRYVESVRRMHTLLRRKGYRDGVNMRYVEDEGAIHNEADWARRLPDALRFLLKS
jgi:predicted alpha/beta superfamily hydrolase